jgi:tetratricopeptide (TPR) repeat protein
MFEDNSEDILMINRSAPSRRIVRRIFLFAAMLVVISPIAAPAVQWQKITRNERYEVALDAESVRITTNGKMAVWLKLTPLGERQRREAAAEYNKKEYRLHMEYYEIDCDEYSAVLGLTDIIGRTGKRLARLKKGDKPFIIIPGSELDMSAQLVCPEQEESLTDEDEAPDAGDNDVTTGTTPSTGNQLSQEELQRIKDALRRTGSEPSSHEAWVELGNAYYDADMPQQAIDSYNRALVLNPDDADVLNDQGAMYRQSGDFTKALKNFEKALAITPYNLESLYNMGYIYAFDLNRIDQAKDVWRRYLELDPSSETASQVKSFIERYGK